VRGLLGAQGFEGVLLGAGEEAGARSERDGRQLEPELVDEPACQGLLGDVGSHQDDVLVVGGGSGLGDGLVQVRQERERGAAHVQGFAWAVGHHEGWCRVGGVVPLVEPDVEGAPAEHHGADGGRAVGDELLVGGRGVTDPFVQA
jgi:hypothetical protein